MKSVKHRKHCCYCPVLKKDPARLLKSIMPSYRILLTKISGKSTRTYFKADDRQSTRERTLSGLLPPVVSLTFQLRSIFTVRFTTPLSIFHEPHECVITGLRIISMNL